jgi:Uma2 family endonuclease
MSLVSVQPVTYGHDASLSRWTVRQYQRMVETGILTAEDKVELLENYVVLKMPRNPRHDSTIQRMLERLFPHRPAGWGLRVQSAVALADSQPEPDFALVRGSAKDYETRHPGPADVGLVIEVADSSLLRDQRDKTRIYARAGLPAYWIINLVDHQIEVYSRPDPVAAPPAYQSCDMYRSGDTVPVVLDGAVVGSVPVADLLP